MCTKMADKKKFKETYNRKSFKVLSSRFFGASPNNGLARLLELHKLENDKVVVYEAYFKVDKNKVKLIGENASYRNSNDRTQGMFNIKCIDILNSGAKEGISELVNIEGEFVKRTKL